MQNNGRNDDNFRIFVVRTIDGIIAETYITGVKDFIFVQISEAERALKRLCNRYYIATDNSEISVLYDIKLIETKVK